MVFQFAILLLSHFSQKVHTFLSHFDKFVNFIIRYTGFKKAKALHFRLLHYSILIIYASFFLAAITTTTAAAQNVTTIAIGAASPVFVD